MRVTFDNFWECSTGIFHYCETPEREPDYVSGLSKYWHDHENQRIIRQSNHWGARIRKCDWYLIDVPAALCTSLPDDRIVTAYCKLKNMLPYKKNNLRRIMNIIRERRQYDDMVERGVVADMASRGLSVPLPR